LVLVRADVGDCKENTEDPDLGVTQETFALRSEDLQKVNGKVAVVLGSACVFQRYRSYMEDYAARVDEVLEQGAAGVIFAEGVPGKIPFQIRTAAETRPVCIIERGEYSRLMNETGWAQASSNFEATADLTRTYLYTDVDDNFLIPFPFVTQVEVNDTWHSTSSVGLNAPLPAVTSTFNPENVPATYARVVEPVWRETCVAAAEYGECTQCWAEAESDSPFTNKDDLRDAIMFINSEFSSTGSRCYLFYFHWALLAHRVQCKGLVFGTPKTSNFYHVSGMYLVPAELTISTYKLTSMHSQALEHMLSEADSQGVRMHLPAVVGSVAVNYFPEPDRSQMEMTSLTFWFQNNSPAQNREPFECDAGQALFNPHNHPGLNAPNDQDSAEPAGILTHAYPTADCSELATCNRCIADGVMINRTRIATDHLGRHPVLVYHLDQWPCVTAYQEFADAAYREINASAAILVNTHDKVYSLLPAGRESAYNSAIPTYNIMMSCGSRIDKDVDTYVLLPPTDDTGAAIVEGYIEPDKSMETTIITTNVDRVAFSDSCTQCTASQANFNPEQYRSTSNEALAVRTVSSCRSLASCVECDQEDNVYQTTSGDALETAVVQGRAVLIDMDDVQCIRPLSNVVCDMLDMQATSVVFVSDEEEIKSLWEAHPICSGENSSKLSIPSFMVAKSSGQSLMAASSQSSLSVRTPRIEAGLAIAENLVGTELSSQDIDRGDGNGGSNNSNPFDNTTYIALIATGCVILFAGLLVMGFWFLQRQKKLYAYNQFDMGIQTGNNLLDIMGCPNEEDGQEMDEFGERRNPHSGNHMDPDCRVEKFKDLGCEDV